MTIQELYDWAVKNDYTNYDITAAYADGGGFYTGHRYTSISDIEVDNNRQEIEI